MCRDIFRLWSLLVAAHAIASVGRRVSAPLMQHNRLDLAPVPSCLFDASKSLVRIG